MYVLGLTGGICAGKSTIAQILRDEGIEVIDADKLGHQAYLPHTPCYHALIDHFGTSIVQEDGTINRRVLGSLVFQHEDKMQELKDIVWPEIRRLAHLEFQRLQEIEHKSLIVFEAAVMIEAKWFDMVDGLWVVYTSPKTAIERLMQRNQLTEEDAKQRLNAQLNNEERFQYAQEIIENDSNQSVEELKTRVLALLAKLPTKDT